MMKHMSKFQFHITFYKFFNVIDFSSSNLYVFLQNISFSFENPPSYTSYIKKEICSDRYRL